MKERRSKYPKELFQWIMDLTAVIDINTGKPRYTATEIASILNKRMPSLHLNKNKVLGHKNKGGGCVPDPIQRHLHRTGIREPAYDKSYINHINKNYFSEEEQSRRRLIDALKGDKRFPKANSDKPYERENVQGWTF
tara:strand:+ start:1095 stop:1505 length:411 start_codon:yes stop_codon:yes gene_type:complete